MATKQELEAQVVKLEAELESLKSAQPLDVQVLSKERDDLKVELQKQALSEVATLGGLQAAGEKIQELQGEVTGLRHDLEVAEAALVDADVQAALAKEVLKTEIRELKAALEQKPVAVGIITKDMIEFDGSAREVGEYVRKKFCHEAQRALILKD
mgnify:CR=1 FL=1